jgi:hypothetical protein
MLEGGATVDRVSKWQSYDNIGTDPPVGMATIVEGTLPPETFALGRVFEHVPEVRVEVERVVPMRSEVMPFFWVWGCDFDRFEEAVTTFGIVVGLERIVDAGDARLYRIHWDGTVTTFLDAIGMAGVVITRASGTRSGWDLTLRFDTHDAVREFRTRCLDEGIGFEVRRVTTVDEWQRNRYDLTEAQQAALLAAFEQGFYAEPRGTSVEELSEQFGISTRAMSGRLRRGMSRLVEATLATIDEPDSEGVFTAE